MIILAAVGIKSILARPLAAFIAARNRQWKNTAVATQERIFKQLLQQGRQTLFGRDHRLDQVNSAKEFKQAVPFREYEGFAPYIERIKKGERDVLWKGLPLYLSKTSGTTSGA